MKPSLFFIAITLITTCSTPRHKSRTPASLFKGKNCRELLSSLISDSKTKVYGDEELVVVGGVEVDVTPIKKYVRSSSLNKKLRSGEEFTPEEAELNERLMKTLAALPNSEAKSYRKITAQAPYNSLDQLLETYAPGKIVDEKAFTSVTLSEDTKVWGDILRADIIMEIDGKTLKDVSQINEFENEAIFTPGTRFRVKEVIGDYEYNETVMIDEDELIADEIAYYAKYFDKYDEYFEEVAASDVNDKFLGIDDIDYGRFTPVEMNNWDDLVRQKIIPIIRIKLEEVVDP